MELRRFICAGIPRVLMPWTKVGVAVKNVRTHNW